jgi:hypothetical protein
MLFNVVIEGIAGRRETQIMTGEQRVVLDNHSFCIRRSNYIDRGPTGISLVLYGELELKISFDSREFKQLFHQEM